MVKCVAQRVRPGRDAQALYIDTYACLSVLEECARNQATLMQETVAAAGIVSDIEGAKPDTDTFLGFELDVRTASWRPSARRYGLHYRLRARLCSRSGQARDRC